MINPKNKGVLIMTENIVYFATGNDHKYKEVASILKKNDINVIKFPVERLEIQNDDPEKIAKYSLEMIKDSPNRIFNEDSGLKIKSLKGFPGPYSSYVYKTIGNEGILKLLKNQEVRDATFYSIIAYKDINNQILIFKGETKGLISEKITKGEGWGYDPIFIPTTDEGNKLTYSELGFELKNILSHRSKSIEKFSKFLTQ